MNEKRENNSNNLEELVDEFIRDLNYDYEFYVPIPFANGKGELMYRCILVYQLNGTNLKVKLTPTFWFCLDEKDGWGQSYNLMEFIEENEFGLYLRSGELRKTILADMPSKVEKKEKSLQNE